MRKLVVLEMSRPLFSETCVLYDLALGPGQTETRQLLRQVVANKNPY